MADRIARLLSLLFRDPHPVQAPELRRAMRDPRIRWRVVDAVLERAARETDKDDRKDS